MVTVGFRDDNGWHGLTRDGEWVCEFPHPESQNFPSREAENMALLAWVAKHGFEALEALRKGGA